MAIPFYNTVNEILMSVWNFGCLGRHCTRIGLADTYLPFWTNAVVDVSLWSQECNWHCIEEIKFFKKQIASKYFQKKGVGLPLPKSEHEFLKKKKKNGITEAC